MLAMFGGTHQHCSMAKLEASVENVTGVVRMLSTISGKDGRESKNVNPAAIRRQSGGGESKNVKRGRDFAV